ncbi:MAG: hypothetical protein ABIK66_05455, partial [candidate division WOR-3 bacterium]
MEKKIEKMKRFLKENKIFFAIVIGATIIGAAIYFTPKNQEKTKSQIVSSTESKVCQNVPQLPDGAIKLVTKVIDGDTFLIEGGYSVRLLGIDVDEKGYPCYNAAKSRLEELILNKKVKLEKGVEDFDQYCR